jgi:hypothetical protein
VSNIYLAAATFGLLFVAWGFVAGDADFSADDGPEGSSGGGLWALLSIRSLAFGALIFGVSGWLGQAGGWTTSTSLLVATVLGAATWVGVSLLFSYLRRTESGEAPGDSLWMGAEGRLVLPFGPDGLGRVEFTAGGQLTELAARRAPDFADLPAESFARCVIEQVVDGTALVSPLSLPASTGSDQ